MYNMDFQGEKKGINPRNIKTHYFTEYRIQCNLFLLNLPLVERSSCLAFGIHCYTHSSFAVPATTSFFPLKKSHSTRTEGGFMLCLVTHMDIPVNCHIKNRLQYFQLFP